MPRISLKPGEGQFRCEGCGAILQASDEVADHKNRHGLVINRADELAEAVEREDRAARARAVLQLVASTCPGVTGAYDSKQQVVTLPLAEAERLAARLRELPTSGKAGVLG